MCADYSRPASGYPFKFGGVNTKTPSDKLPEHKYSVAQNIRAFDDQTIRSRPGLTEIVSSGLPRPVESIGSYATLNTSNVPRLLFKVTGANIPPTPQTADIFLDTGAAVDTGYAPSVGASMIPYRPNQSPQSFMYVGDSSQYRKLSAPDATNTVIAQNVGIVEPQAPVDFGIGNSFFTPLSVTNTTSVNYTASGTAALVTTGTLTDTVAAVFQDPALPPGTLPEYTCQTTSSSASYQSGMWINIGSPSPDNYYQVKDVYPALVGTVTIAAIYYYSGTTGRCVVVPYNISNSDNSELSLLQQNLLTGIRRGALVQLNSEVCYVLGTAVAPDGTLSFEVVTTDTHAAGETLTGVPAIKVLLSSNFAGGGGFAPASGAAIATPYLEFRVATGIGTIQTPIGTTTPFSYQNTSYRSSDYIHFRIGAGGLALAALTEIKLLLDVSDGMFDSDYYFYAFRPSDIQAGIANTLTQLGVAQLVAQRETIDEESAAQGATASSAATLPGGGALVYSDLYVPLSQFTRVGSNQALSLLNINAIQVLVNQGTIATVNSNFFLGSVDLCGGFSPEATPSEAGYQYVIRPRSTLTGAIGNPSPPPRYSINPRREEVQVVLPTTYADSQVDTLDVFRVGGSINTYTFIGRVPLGTAYFYDNYADADIASNEQLDYENFQPWPTIDLPLNTTSTSSCGTTAIVTIPASLHANVERYLPGNLVQIGQQVYTLWTRPTQISGNNFLFQFVENTGAGTGLSVSIYEPNMANQILPYLWGPTEEGGNVFGCGDALRPGFVYFSKNFNPDSAPDNYNIELCPPSEPLQGGEILNGNSYVASTNRWWQLRPSFGGVNQFTPIEAPVGRGLAAPFGVCTEGSKIYFVARDGIWITGGGPGQSLTDEDLYNLFPHDGVLGQNVTYNGITMYAPDYNRAGNFRLTYYNSYLYFDYQDITGGYHTLVLDIRHQAWSTDVYLAGAGAAIHYAVGQQQGDIGASDVVYPLIVGDTSGTIYMEADGVIDNTSPISCALATRESTEGDARAQKLFGDYFLDFLNPTSGGATNLQGQAMSLGTAYETTAFTQSATRQQLPVNLPNGGIYSFALGVFLTWTISVAQSPVVLYTWQPSYIGKPEQTTGRAGDWDNCGYEGAKWMQGFLLECFCAGTKQIGVRNSDNDTLEQVFAVTQPIQSEVAYSFTTPFVAHMVRYEPQDDVDWTFFNIKWIWEKTPETVATWWCQFSDLDWQGYGHCFSCNFAYAAQAPVQFTMFIDGASQLYTLPSTGGVYQKYFFNFQANKGKLYAFRAQSTAGFADLQVWEDDTVIQCGGWGRTSEYRVHLALGGNRGNTAKI